MVEGEEAKTVESYTFGGRRRWPRVWLTILKPECNTGGVEGPIQSGQIPTMRGDVARHT